MTSEYSSRMSSRHKGLEEPKVLRGIKKRPLRRSLYSEPRENLSVASKPNKSQDFQFLFTCFAIQQDQVVFHMAVSETLQLSAKLMVPIFRIQFYVVRQIFDNIIQLLFIEFLIKSEFLQIFQILLSIYDITHLLSFSYNHPYWYKLPHRQIASLLLPVMFL